MAAASNVLALGFGRLPESVVFGAPLDLSVPLRALPQELPAPECLAADVRVGEQRVAPQSLRVWIDAGDAGPVLRLRSGHVVEEPVVTVSLSVGCPARLSRTFTLLADPPASQPMAMPVATPTSARRRRRRRLDRGSTSTSTPSADAGASQPVAAVPAGAASMPVTATAAEARRPAPAARRKPRASAKARTAPPKAVAAVPRLKVEPAEPTAAPAPPAVPEAALAALAAAQGAASAAEARATALEATVHKLRAEAAAQQAAVAQMRARVSDSDASGRWLPSLLALLVVLAGGVLWLALQLRKLRRERERGWWQADADAVVSTAAPAGANADGFGVSLPPPARIAESAPVAEPDAAETYERALARTAPLPPNVTTGEPGLRPVSVEELIDLEQQAEFFIVLGQDDAAIDLLMRHLRNSGGGSPLPYLKLLEIYKRRGEREAYDRTRTRFNDRFNAYAPDWDADLEQGRTLQDYAQVIVQLQAAWAVPMDAMAVLETLLFRNHQAELFDLPRVPRRAVAVCGGARPAAGRAGRQRRCAAAAGRTTSSSRPTRC